MELDINRNPYTNGYCCYFSFNDKHYYADVSIVNYSNPDYQGECMIFETDDNKLVISWLELYCNPNVPVSKESLQNCIEEFINNK